MNFKEGTPSFQSGASSASATISHLDYVAQVVARHKHRGFALPSPWLLVPWQIITVSEFVDSLDALTSADGRLEVVRAALQLLDPRTDGTSKAPGSDSGADCSTEEASP